MTGRPFTTFRSRAKLKEMLMLREKGVGCTALSRVYKCDVSTIRYHCDLAGVIPQNLNPSKYKIIIEQFTKLKVAPRLRSKNQRVTIPIVHFPKFYSSLKLNRGLEKYSDYLKVEKDRKDPFKNGKIKYNRVVRSLPT